MRRNFSIKVYHKRKRLSIFFKETDTRYFTFIVSGSLGKAMYKLAKRGSCLINKPSLTLFFTKSAMNGFLAALKQRILGVSRGFYTFLILRGLGYRFRKKRYSFSQPVVRFKLGFKHFYNFTFPAHSIAYVVRYKLLLFMPDKTILSRLAHEMRLLRFPDPYKAKGVRFKEEPLVFKPGKQRS